MFWSINLALTEHLAIIGKLQNFENLWKYPGAQNMSTNMFGIIYHKQNKKSNLWKRDKICPKLGHFKEN